MSKNKSWIMTRTGKHFHLLNPSIDEICEEDIAHALSNICRFTGHTSIFYSVALHSILCFEQARKNGESLRIQLLTLLHDSSEAYLTDVNKPLKDVLGTIYTDIEDNVMSVIYDYFKISQPNEEELARVKYYDMLLFKNEAKLLMPNPIDYKPYFLEKDEEVNMSYLGWSNSTTAQVFLDTLQALIRMCENEKG